MRLFLAAALAAASAPAAFAQETPAPGPARPSLQTLEGIIESREPEIHVAQPDHERITARRIDIVDENGTVRMVLAAPTPNPIIDGIQYRRAFDVAGITIYDAAGSERGGFGVADIEGSMAVLALDHPATDAIGGRVAPDGGVSFVINDAPDLVREPGLEDRLIPGVENATRIKLEVAADGQPAIALSDADDRPRLRLTVTPEGYGAIEFLNTAGEVVSRIAPEAGD